MIRLPLLLKINFTLSFLLACNACSIKKGLEKADKAYATGEYHNAISRYTRIYSRIKDKDVKLATNYKIAEGYKKLRNPRKAISYYKRLKILKFDNTKYILDLAEMHRMNEQFEEALKLYEEYLELHPHDTLANLRQKACLYTLQQLEKTPKYKIENMKSLNSRQNDYCPSYSDDTYRNIYFTSSRKEALGNKKSKITGTDPGDIFSSTLQSKKRWTTPMPASQTINTELDEGACTLNELKDNMYFTRNLKENNKILGVQIYMTQEDNGEWQQPALVEIVNDSSLIFAHPSISRDELTLYFTSNMPEGYGELDIWKITRSSKIDKWEKPINLGPTINTPGTEAFPYIRSDEILFFSSDNHLGIGGLDIFKAKENEPNEWKIENMEIPINSAADDFGIIFENDLTNEEERGFFSSNRKKGRGGDDIYSLHLPAIRFRLLVNIVSEKENTPMEEASIKIIGSNGTIKKLNTKEDGLFSYNLNKNTDYIYVISKQGYLNEKARTSTINLVESEDLKQTIKLKSIQDAIEIPNIIYKSGSFELTDDSYHGLNFLIEILELNPTILVEIGAHTDYIGNEEFNLTLSQKRAQVVVNYLIKNNINPKRLVAKGYGESAPKKVTTQLFEKHQFLKQDVLITEKYIEALATEKQKDLARAINRRTEIKVLPD